MLRTIFEIKIVLLSSDDLVFQVSLLLTVMKLMMLLGQVAQTLGHPYCDSLCSQGYVR